MRITSLSFPEFHVRKWDAEALAVYADIRRYTLDTRRNVYAAGFRLPCSSRFQSSLT